MNIKINKYDVIIFIIYLIILFYFCYLIYKSNKPQLPKFLIENEYPVLLTDKPFFKSNYIPQPNFLKSAHSSSIAKLPNSNLIAFWFAGSREGASDVKIWQSIYNGKNWSMAHAIISPQIISYYSNRYTKKVGNPVVYLAKNAILHLFIVSVSIGGWSGSSLNHFISNDNGNNWQAKEKLILNPFFNISTLDRINAVSLDDGGFYLPVYHELIRTYPEILRFDNEGNFLYQVRLTNQNTLLQPTLLPISIENAFVYMRNNRRFNEVLYYQKTSNAGLSWGRILPTNLTNEDSSLVVKRIKNNQYIMIHNKDGRSKLVLALSSDGIVWKDYLLLENSLRDEFSYPSIDIDNGVINILYTWKRLKIKHVQFNLKWLELLIQKTDKDRLKNGK